MRERIKWFSNYFKDGTGKLDPKFTEYQDKLLQRTKERALELLVLEEADIQAAKEIILLAPNRLDVKNDVKFKIVEHEDGECEVVFDQALVTRLMFGKDRLYYYQAATDIRYNIITDDVAGEVAYDNIVNVEISTYYDDLEHVELDVVDLDLWLKGGNELNLRLRQRAFVGRTEKIKLTDTEKEVLKALHSVLRK